MRFPDQKTSVIVLANRADAKPTSKSYQVADIVLKDQFIEVKETAKKEKEVDNQKASVEFSKEIDVSEINLNDYVGVYFSEELNAFYNIIFIEGMLQLKMARNSPIKIKASAKDQFNAEGGVLRFDRKEDFIIGFELDAGRVQNLKFKKRSSE